MQLEHVVVEPTHRRYAAPLLCLHGAWHGAWCWQRAMTDLAERGFEVHAISLRGHGASERAPNHRRSSTRDYGQDLITAVRGFAVPPVIIGHSTGGYLTQLYLTGVLGEVPPVAGAVLVCSSPVNIMRYFILRRTPPEARVDPRAMLRLEPATMQRLFFRPDLPPQQLAHYLSQMVTEPPLIALQSMVLRPRPTANRTPMLVLAAGRDMVFDAEAQAVTAAAYGAELVLVPSAAHDLMLDPDWPVAAAAIERFAGQFGSSFTV